jgi:hypothetical protein
MMNDTNKKILGISQVGGLLGIVYAFQTKSGVLKGTGFYLLGTFAFGLGAMAFYNIKKD